MRDISGLSDRVDLRACLERLAPELQSTYCSRRGIGFGLSLGHLLVEARTAHALCLIVAELVSNACKHAFAGRAFGYVEIGSEVIDRERSRIWVADNGIGLAARAAAQFSGLDIVQQLAKGIGADLVRETLLGTRVTVSFSNAS